MARLLTILLWIHTLTLFGQTCDLEIRVNDGEDPLPDAVVEVGTRILGLTDNHGVFRYEGPCPQGTITIRKPGFIPVVKSIPEVGGKQVEISLKPDPLMLSEIVISGTRTDRRRVDNPIAVNILDQKTFRITQSQSLAEGMCFQPGLRVETDCQTCNYTQVRMNGLGGSYTQILIDSRPIFTSIMGLYGLEIIPASQIDRVEVVRGGGSALFGANAIAGTINILTKRPEKSGFNIQYSPSLIGGSATDQVWTGSGTWVSKDRDFGLTLTGNHRERDPYDANDDGYSELPEILNNSLGLRGYWKPSDQHSLRWTTWKLYEYRRGGNGFDLPADQADQSEERDHDIWAGTLDHTFTSKSIPLEISSYFGFQHTTRDHYTGIEQSPGWGNTLSTTLMGGVQANYELPTITGPNRLTVGAESQWDDTYDAIPAYQYLIDQTTLLHGIFLQSDWDLGSKWTLLSGLRYNIHNFLDKGVFTPRVSLLFKPHSNWQLRSSWSSGFKPPQAFETDMHIAFAGGGISYIRIDPDLKEETSNSLSLSVDANFPHEHHIWGFTMEGFFTRLSNPFILEETTADDNGNQVLMRTNGSPATVAGVTLELRGNWDGMIQVESGFTLQMAQFEKAVAWSAETKPETDFLRTPGKYGFMTLSFFPDDPLSGSISMVYTGTMKVPHFGGAPEQPVDAMVNSPSFTEVNLRTAYKRPIKGTQLSWEISAGIQNLFNAYQSDFDTGRFRDSNYIYGPARPRTLFLGFRFSG